MSLDRAGRTLLIPARSAVTVDDAVYPSGATQAGSVTIPSDYHGSITHCLVRAVGSAAGVACRITIYGYNTAADQWYAVVQMQDGSTLTGTTNTPVTDGNNINVAESFAHISAFDRLYALIDQIASMAAGGVNVWFMLEGP